MATREKTIIYSFPMTTTLVADASVTNLSQITVYVPEASPTFTSVFVEVGFQDVITATGGTITEHRVGLRLGAASYNTITELDNITQSGENIAGVLGPFDFTSHFNTNWTGTSMTADCQVYFDQDTGTTQGMANVTAVLYVTYTYDDDTVTNATQIKSVYIPFESRTTTLPTSATNFGTGQIPQLTGVGGMLPEASPVIRDYFFLIEGNENNNNVTTDWTMSANIDGGATTAFMTQECALASDRFCRWIYKPSVPDTSTTHNLQLWASTARANSVTVTLVVTYEFDASATTRLLNSVWLPMEIASPMGRTTTTDQSRFFRTFTIQDPGTITMRQSGYRINWNCAGTVTNIATRAGSQPFRTYAHVANVVCGMFSLQHRIDSGSAGGAGLTVARGSNEIVIDAYCTNPSIEPTNINGYIILNYESDVGSGGIGQNTHTIRKDMYDWNAQLLDYVTVANFSIAIPEANYWLVGSGFCLIMWPSTSTLAVTLDAQCKTGEGKESGYVDIYADGLTADSERACSMIWARGRDIFRRYPTDPSWDRIDIETARDYRKFTTATTSLGMVVLVSYHSFTYSVSGTISDNNASLPTTVKLIHELTGEIRGETELAAGVTAFNFTVNDNTDNYYVDAYQDNTLTGRSGTGTAT